MKALHPALLPAVVLCACSAAASAYLAFSLATGLVMPTLA